MKIYYVNIYDTLTLVASSAQLPYPIENVQQQHLPKVWKPTGKVSENIVGNTGAFTPDGAFIAGHNFTESAVIKIQGNDSDSWGSPTVDITMTRGEHYYYAFTGFSELAYWRFLIADSTNPDDIEVGRAWLGVAVEIPVPSRQFTENIDDTTNIDFGLTGQSFGDIGYQFREMDIMIPKNTEAQKAILKTYYATVKKAQPHFVNFAVGMEDRLEPMYSLLLSKLALRNIKTLVLWGTKLSYLEAK